MAEDKLLETIKTLDNTLNKYKSAIHHNIRPTTKSGKQKNK